MRALNFLLPTQVSATDAAGSLDIRAGNTINILSGQQTSHYTSSFDTGSGGGFIGGGGTTTTTVVLDSTQALGSTLSGNTINLQSGGNANIVGSNIHGSGSVQMTAGGNLNILASSNTLAQERSSQTSAGLMGNSGKSSDSMTQTTAASSTITGGNIQMQSAGDTTLQAAHISGNSLAISAGTINGQTINPNAKLNIDAAIQSQSKTHTSSGSDLMTQNSSNSGKISQSLAYATINLSNSQNTNPSPTLKTAGGIVVGVSNLPGNGTSNASGGPLAHI